MAANDKTKAAKAKKAAAKEAKLAATVQEYFGSTYAKWTTAELKTHFGEDLLKLLYEISDPNGIWEPNTTEGIAGIQRAFRATKYWDTYSSSAQLWDKKSDADKREAIDKTKRLVASKYGDLQFDDATLTDIATKISKGALDAIAQEQLIFSTAYARQPVAGTTTEQIDVSGTDDANKLRTIAKKFNYNPSDLDQQIQSILTGQKYSGTGTVITEDWLRNNARTVALGAYPHLKTQFDAGLSLDDVFSPYRSGIAQILELAENEIDFANPKYSKFLGTAKDGQVSLGDALTMVKTDPTFNYQFTKRANQDATDIGLAIARAFGKVA
jgi:hypothetical protein